MHRFDHSRPDLKPCGFTCGLWKAAPMRRLDRHNEIELNLLKHGSPPYLLGGERVTMPQESVGAFLGALRLELHARLQRRAGNLPPPQPTAEYRPSSALLGGGGLSNVEPLAA